ncbi:unnamed protein product (mitochondrion) [Plasmodiophora brassicae]|uniref:RING-type domain-containing protein n=1 Tax=Plasmodiophora brassicae TaxID=37360 RepID=A0A0G4J6Y4_PLABS|nr:hypothetical protein PBRA_009274 [Plasmodiophora brassicae]SPR01635.1 unnamed protein product [Plasmodiophora brassicae]
MADTDDWLATLSIFDCEPRSDGGTAIDLDLSTPGVVFVVADDTRSSCSYRILADKGAIGTVTAAFTFRDGVPDHVSVSSESIDEEWVAWINKHAQSVLEDEPNSALVCQAIVCDAVQFLPIITGTASRLAALVPSRILDASDMQRPGVSDVERLHAIGNLDTCAMGDFARHAALSVQVASCPICLYATRVLDMVSITCLHLYCRDCSRSWLRSQLDDIRRNGRGASPLSFCCAVLECRAPMQDIGCLDRLLGQQERKDVLEWRAAMAMTELPMEPRLAGCPKRSCSSRTMVRFGRNARAIVYCDECGATWCETCLGRIRDEHQQCDMGRVGRLISWYDALADGVREELARRRPWIREYVAWVKSDDSARDWCLTHASVCPGCGTGIEKTDGCFHMACPVCHVHFCYRCGNRFHPDDIYTHTCFTNPDIFLDNFIDF